MLPASDYESSANWASCTISGWPPFSPKHRLPRAGKGIKCTPFCLPSHTSHFLQPLDLAVYGPLKTTWKAISKDYKVATHASNLTKEAFSSIVGRLWEKRFQSLHLKAGFHACGLFPFYANAVFPYKMVTALPFTINSEGMPAPSKPETSLMKELRHFFADHLKPIKGESARN